MKIMIKQTCLAITVVGLSIATAPAQCQQPPPQVNVSGTAEIKVAPDEVDISAGVETRDVQLNTATHQNDEHMASALAFLRSAGVPEKDIQTDSMQVQPDYASDSLISPRYYTVRKSLEIKLTSVTNLENVVTGLLNHGVNGLYSVDFRTSELRKYRDQARAMAIKAAKEKAVAMCAALDVKCGKPNAINVQDFGGYYSWAWNGWSSRGNNLYANNIQNAVQSGGGESEVAGETVSRGQIAVSATVNVSFLIQ